MTAQVIFPFVDLLKFRLFASCNLCYVIYPVKKEDILFFLFKAHGIFEKSTVTSCYATCLMNSSKEVLDSCEYGGSFHVEYIKKDYCDRQGLTVEGHWEPCVVLR